MTEVQNLASFVAQTRFADLSENAVEELKICVFDTLGVASLPWIGVVIVSAEFFGNLYIHKDRTRILPLHHHCELPWKPCNCATRFVSDKAILVARLREG